jgi:Fur family ferric uptake transcriptional regulator
MIWSDLRRIQDLEAMTAKDIVTKINIDGADSALFELRGISHSHHLICMGCKKILTISFCPLQSYEKSLKKETILRYPAIS